MHGGGWWQEAKSSPAPAGTLVLLPIPHVTLFALADELALNRTNIDYYHKRIEYTDNEHGNPVFNVFLRLQPITLRLHFLSNYMVISK